MIFWLFSKKFFFIETLTKSSKENVTLVVVAKKNPHCYGPFCWGCIPKVIVHLIFSKVVILSHFYHNSDQLYLMKIIFGGVAKARAVLLRPNLQRKWGGSTQENHRAKKFQLNHNFFKFYQNFTKITIEIVIFGLVAKEEAHLLGPILQGTLLYPLKEQISVRLL